MPSFRDGETKTYRRGGGLAGVFEEQSKPVGAVGDKVKEVRAGGGARVKTQQ